MEIRPHQIEELSNRLYDASDGLYGELTIDGYEMEIYVTRMMEGAIVAMLWADCRHICPETETYGDCRCDVRLTADNISDHYQEELFNQCESFVRDAWWYLNEDNIPPDMAGHDFHLTRNHHGAGFWDRGYKYGAQLTELAGMYGDASVEYETDSDGEITNVYVNL